MPETEPQQPDIDRQLDVFVLNGRTLRAWHDFLCNDSETDMPTGHLRVPASRYGTTTEDCSWWAIAAECVTVDANGLADDPEASIDYCMGLVVNDHDDIMRLVRENKNVIPLSILERLEIEDEEDLSVPTPGRQFGNPRDEALHTIWRGAWTQASSGEAGSPTGPFARVSNSEADIDDVADAFSAELEEIGVDTRQLLGHFLLAELSVANLGVVIPFTDEDALLSAFGALKQIYEDWKQDKRDGRI